MLVVKLERWTYAFKGRYSYVRIYWGNRWTPFCKRTLRKWEPVSFGYVDK